MIINMSDKNSNINQKKLAKITNVLPKQPFKPTNESDEKYNIIYALKPFYIVLQLLGLQKVRFNGDEMNEIRVYSKLYSFLIALAIFSVQIMIIIDKFMYEYKSSEPTQALTDLLFLIPSAFSCIVSVIMSATCNNKMILRTLKNFQVVDRQLCIDQSQINKPLRLKIIAAMVFCFLWIIGLFISEMFFLSDYRMSVINAAIGNINDFVLLELAVLLYIIALRLDVLNTQLEATKYDVSKLFDTQVATIMSKRRENFMAKFGDGVDFSQKFGVKNVNVNDQVEDLTRLMRIFDRLADNANIVNSCFGIPLLCSAIMVFDDILSTVNKVITWSNHTTEENQSAESVIILIVWCIRILFFVTMLTAVSEIVQGKVKKMSNILNKLSISSKLDPRRQEYLERFSQLMFCRTFTITACNFFAFDFTFIYSLVGAVATYIVILLQVNQPTTTPKKT